MQPTIHAIIISGIRPDELIQRPHSKRLRGTLIHYSPRWTSSLSTQDALKRKLLLLRCFHRPVHILRLQRGAAFAFRTQRHAASRKSLLLRQRRCFTARQVTVLAHLLPSRGTVIAALLLRVGAALQFLDSGVLPQFFPVMS